MGFEPTTLRGFKSHLELGFFFFRVLLKINIMLLLFHLLRIATKKICIIQWRIAPRSLIFWETGPKGGFKGGQGAPPPPPLLSEFCSFVKVFRIVLRALLLKYIFCNKHC